MTTHSFEKLWCVSTEKTQLVSLCEDSMSLLLMKLFSVTLERFCLPFIEKCSFFWGLYTTLNNRSHSQPEADRFHSCLRIRHLQMFQISAILALKLKLHEQRKFVWLNKSPTAASVRTSWWDRFTNYHFQDQERTFNLNFYAKMENKLKQ